MSMLFAAQSNDEGGGVNLLLVALTGYGQDEDVRESRAAGFAAASSDARPGDAMGPGGRPAYL